jgi:hypothetical protein
MLSKKSPMTKVRLPLEVYQSWPRFAPPPTGGDLPLVTDLMAGQINLGFVRRSGGLASESN